MEEGSVSRRPKYMKLEEKRDHGSSIQLCDLPDSLLHHILSFLPTQYVVRTSVLSKRWQHVWESIPYLHFDQNGFSTSPIFCKFVERTLLLRDLSFIEEFSLSCAMQNDYSQVSTWITTAVKRNAKVLKVLLSSVNRPYVVPHCIFRSEVLEKLVLRVKAPLRIPASACLSNLRVLTLKYVIFVDDDSTQKLLSCPTLEELSIDYCDWRNLTKVKIFAPKLLELSIVDNDSVHEEKNTAAYQCWVLIHAARIRSFRYLGELIKKYCITTSSLNLKATVSLHRYTECVTATVAYNAYELLKGLSSVRCLLLNCGVLKFLSCGDELLNGIPTFSNMTELILDCRVDKGYQVSWMILGRSPCLETLEFEDFGIISSEQDHQVPVPVPLCFQSHLKKIVVRGFNATEEHISAVAHLLVIAVVLEEIVIHYFWKSSGMKAEELLKRLTQLPKGSVKCTIYLVVLYGNEFMRLKIPM